MPISRKPDEPPAQRKSRAPHDAARPFLERHYLIHYQAEVGADSLEQ